MKPATDLLLLTPFAMRVLSAVVTTPRPGLVALHVTARDMNAADRHTIDRSALMGLADMAAAVALNEAAPPGATWRIRELAIELQAPAEDWVTASADASSLDWTKACEVTLAIAMRSHKDAAVALARVEATIMPPRH